MEEDEYDDELPPISVNCSSKVESVFSMPSAEELASQRAREEACERELREMREQHEKQQAALDAVANGTPTLPSRSNSSSSEGEATLASAVEALRVGSSPAGGARRPAAGALLAGVLPQLPPAARAFCQDYADALRTAGASDIHKLNDDLVTGIGSWLCGFDVESARPAGARDESSDTPPENSPSDDEVLGVCAWLCACALSRDAPRARTRRALHAALAVASTDQVSKLCGVLLRAWRDARSRLELCASVCAAGREPHALALGAALCRAALADLLGATEAADVSTTDVMAAGPLSLQELAELARGGWRGVAGEQRDIALQLLGRALGQAKLAAGEAASEQAAAGQAAAGQAAAGQAAAEQAAAGQAAAGQAAAGQTALARALAALAPPAAAPLRHQPDHLKVAVAASKLQILLSDRN